MLYMQRHRDNIARWLPSASIGAEIGVFTGRFAKRLAKLTNPRTLYLIDPWWTRYGDVFSFRPALATQTAYDATVQRMKWWIERDIVQVVVKRSQEALAEMPSEHLDWVYLDSSHDYVETLEELELCSKKVKGKGVIAGHDFNTRRHPGVFRALTEFLQTHPEYELSYQDNHHQWGIRRREHSAP